MELKRCENCGKMHDGSFGSGRFCSDRCRRSYCGKKSGIKRKNNPMPVGSGPIKPKEGGWKCPYCDEVFVVRKQLNQHKREKHAYVDEFGKRKSWNKGQTKENNPSIAKMCDTRKRRIKEGSLVIKGHPHSEETKKKLSEIRKKYIMEHPEKAPYRLCHRHLKGESYPERYFRHVLSNNAVKYIQEVQCGLYSMDFLIGDVDLEIDGEQHYSDVRVSESDKRRTKFIEDLGFKVKRIRWSEFSKLNHDKRVKFIRELIDFLKRTNESPLSVINNKVEMKYK